MEDKEVTFFQAGCSWEIELFVPDEINILHMTSRTLDDKIPPERKTFRIK